MLQAQRPFSAVAHGRRSTVVVRARAGGPQQPFNENAAQVKRLVTRDRKELLGNEVVKNKDILEVYKTEFADGVAESEASSSLGSNPFLNSSTATATTTAPASTSSTTPAAAVKVSVSGANPFGSPSPNSPFGSPAAPKPFKSVIEPKGLTPDMGPDPIIKEAPIDFLKTITLPQVLTIISFMLIIGLMIATFTFVLNVGGIRLAGLE